MLSPAMALRELFRRIDHDATFARPVLGGGRQVDVIVGVADADRTRARRGRYLLDGLSGLGIDHHERRARGRMIVSGELRIEIRTAIAAETDAAYGYLAGRDVEDREVAAGFGIGAVGTTAAQKDGELGDDLQAVRVAPIEFVQHELAGFGLGLR